MNTSGTENGTRSEHVAERPSEAEATNNPYSQRDHGTGPRGDKATTATIREIPPLDALTAAVCLIRSDWNPAVVRATIARTHGSWQELAVRALRVATDPDARTPLGIENADMRRHDTTPAAMHIRDARAATRCPNGAIHDPHPCALCRAGITPTEETNP